MKKSISFLLAVSLTTLMVAQSLSPDQLYERAQAFAAQMHHSKALPQLQTLTMDCCPGIAVYNVENGGFVVACGDERARTILGYSDKGSIDPDNLSPELAYWLGEYSDQIRQLGSRTLKELQNSNNTLQNSKKTFPANVTPLLVTAWNQNGFGYNSKCPVDSSLVDLDYHPTVGCTALALGQVIRYWQWPDHGTGHHAYSRQSIYGCWRYDTLSADFEHATYDYANMPDSLNSNSTAAQVDAVATLLYHCGVAVGMSYNVDCNGSSGSNDICQLNALKRYFNYSPNAQVLLKANHSVDEWINYLKTDLSNGRPVLYHGVSQADSAQGYQGGGHAFVCDGYDSTNMFHFNWGWEGQGNGYFALDLLNPLGQYNFVNTQTAIIGLEPSQTPDKGSIFVLGGNLIIHDAVLNDTLRGSYRIANVGDTAGEIHVALMATIENTPIGALLQTQSLTIPAGDTIDISFDLSAEGLPACNYLGALYFSDIPIADMTVSTTFFNDNYYDYQTPFSITDNQGITTAETEAQGMTIYPNPAKDQVTVTLPSSSSTLSSSSTSSLSLSSSSTLSSTLSSSSTLSLYTTLGQRVLEQPMQGTTCTLSLSGINPGVYILRCGTEVRKLVVK